MIPGLDPCSSCNGSMFSSWCDGVASRNAAEMSTKCREIRLARDGDSLAELF